MKFGEYADRWSSWDDYGPNSDNINLITEAGFSRVLSKIEDNESFMIITAYKDEYDKKENIKRNRQLRVEFNKRKMGPYQLVGHWQECQDKKVDYYGCPKNMLVDVIERSYLAIKPDDMTDDEFKSFTVLLVNEFDQNEALIKLDETYYTINKIGRLLKIGTKLSLGKISRAYSQFVKKMNIPFVFEGMEHPGSISGRREATMCGIKYPIGKFDDLRNWGDIVC